MNMQTSRPGFCYPVRLISLIALNILGLSSLTIHLPSQFFSVCIESALLISLAVMVFDTAARKWTPRSHGHHARMVEWAASALWDVTWRLLTLSLLRVVEIFHLGWLVVIYLPDGNAQPRLWTAVLCFTITQVNHKRYTKVALMIKIREQHKG